MNECHFACNLFNKYFKYIGNNFKEKKRTNKAISFARNSINYLMKYF